MNVSSECHAELQYLLCLIKKMALLEGEGEGKDMGRRIRSLV